MKIKVFQAFVICAILFTTFLAFYLRVPVVSIPQETPKPKEVRKVEKDKLKEIKFEVNKSFENDQEKIFTVPIDTKQASHIGILGESRGDEGAEEAINSTVLNQLFEALKVRQVQAIFFAGNLISGVVKGDDDNIKPIDSQILKKNLQQFSELYDSIFNSEVPFYPAIGEREIMIPQSAEEYKKHFHLEGAKNLGNEFLYEVSVGRSFFVVIATDELNEDKTHAEQTFSEPMLAWLESALKEGAKKHKYLFVVGYEPAFPSESTYSKAHLPQRDAFWKVLVDNKVSAYFSSKEHLFDRSYRSGVWQIITGGGGAPLSQGGGSQPFFHCLMLTIPPENAVKDKFPSIQVIDNSGKIIEEFSLSAENQPLYQMRISSN